MTRRTEATAPVAKAAYHHGDLRSALIAAAREALETSAPEAVTLKSLAVRLGVSQPAPYRHFDSRDALLAAVAADGFARFRQSLIDATQDASEAERFELGCLAYLAFGRANRGVYRLMFGSHLDLNRASGELHDKAFAAFDFLLASVAGRVPEAQVRLSAVWIWSTLHGLVTLSDRGLGPDGATRPEEVIRYMVQVLGAAG